MDDIEVKKMHHRNAPETEVAAAVRIAPRVTGLRRKALRVLAESPQGETGEQVAEIMDEWLYSVKPRLTELSQFGLIEDSGRRNINKRNRQEIIWQITERGYMTLLYKMGGDLANG